MRSSLVPEVPDEEVLGAAPRRGVGAAGSADARENAWGRWVPWVIAGLLLLSVAWGLLVITP